MSIVMGLDQHRAQITAEWLDIGTGEVRRARIAPADRAGARAFLEGFRGRRLEVALEGTTGWRFVVEKLRAIGASRRQVVWRVLVPATMPGVMDTLRITMGWAWTYLVVAELVAANRGLGYMILNSMRGLFTDRIFVGIMVIGLLGLLTDQAFKRLHRWLLPWSPKAG